MPNKNSLAEEISRFPPPPTTIQRGSVEFNSAIRRVNRWLSPSIYKVIYELAEEGANRDLIERLLSLPTAVINYAASLKPRFYRGLMAAEAQFTWRRLKKLYNTLDGAHLYRLLQVTHSEYVGTPASTSEMGQGNRKIIEIIDRALRFADQTEAGINKVAPSESGPAPDVSAAGQVTRDNQRAAMVRKGEIAASDVDNIPHATHAQAAKVAKVCHPSALPDLNHRQGQIDPDVVVVSQPDGINGTQQRPPLTPMQALAKARGTDVPKKPVGGQPAFPAGSQSSPDDQPSSDPIQAALQRHRSSGADLAKMHSSVVDDDKDDLF